MGQPATKESSEDIESDNSDDDDEAYEFVEILPDKNLRSITKSETIEEQTNMTEEADRSPLSTEKYFIQTTTTSTTTKSTYELIQPIEVEKVTVAESEAELQHAAPVDELVDDEKNIFVYKNTDQKHVDLAAVEPNEESDGSVEDYVLIEEVTTETLGQSLESETEILVRTTDQESQKERLDTTSSPLTSSTKRIDEGTIEHRGSESRSLTKSLDEGYSSPKSPKSYTLQYHETEIEFEPLDGTTNIVDDATTQEKALLQKGNCKEVKQEQI